MTLQGELLEKRKILDDLREAVSILREKPKYAPNPSEFDPLRRVEGLLAGAASDAEREARLQALESEIQKAEESLKPIEMEFADTQQELLSKSNALHQDFQRVQSLQTELLELLGSIKSKGGELNRLAKGFDGSEPVIDRLGPLDQIELVWADSNSERFHIFVDAVFRLDLSQHQAA